LLKDELVKRDEQLSEADTNLRCELTKVIEDRNLLSL